MVKHLAWDKPELTINNPFEPGCSLHASGRSRLSPNLFRSHCGPPGIPPEPCWLAQSSSVGQAQLFGPDPNNPNNPDLILLQTFNDPTTGINSNDLFGTAMAIDGNLALIGAPGDDTGFESAGQAHLFDADTGAELQRLDNPVDHFRNLMIDGGV